MHMLVSMYYCIYMFSYGPYGPEIKHYYYYYYYYCARKNRLLLTRHGCLDPVVCTEKETKD